MAKETYYFSHDSNAITDTKILNMRCDYGLEGYGLYWAIIEMLRNEKDYRLQINKNTYRAIKILTSTNIDIEKYINDCIEDYKLFNKQEDKFYSSSLLKRMLEYERKKEKNRENGKLGGRPKKTEKEPNGFENETQKNQSKEKESKEKENKIKENKVNKNNNKNSNADGSCFDGLKNVNDSCIDDLQDVIDFYNNNIGFITPYILELLQDYANELGNEIVIYAMKISVEANKKTIQYIKAILNNWKNAGIKTLIEAMEESGKSKRKNINAEEEFLNECT